MALKPSCSSITSLSYVCYSLNVSTPSTTTGPVKQEEKKTTPVIILAEVLYAHVYPNPYLGSFTLAVQSPETGMATVELFDATGKKIMTRQLPVVKGVKNTISFTGIRQQFLMYKITVGKQIATGKITGLN